jgi:adenylate cyclase
VRPFSWSIAWPVPPWWWKRITGAPLTDRDAPGIMKQEATATMPQVIIEQPGIAPKTIPLAGKEIVFGRSEDCDVVLVAEEVSRRHACISRDDGRTLLRDLKSLNGTYVNRQRVVERVLSHMDEVWFGSKCHMIYRDDTQFGRAEGADAGEDTTHDSKLLQDINDIRAEMEEVGNSMTMLGQNAGRTDAVASREEKPDDQEMAKMGRAYRRMAAMYKASQVMASHFDLDKRLSDVLDIVMDVMNADRGFVMLRDEGTDNLNVKVARQMGQELTASSPSMGIAGRAAIDGEPVLMSDRTTDQEFGMRDSIIMGQIFSAMCAPLQIKSRILGSIYVDSRKHGVSFTGQDLELFTSLASQAAMAIDNVQMHDKMVASEKRRQNLCRFLPSQIVEKIMSEDTDLELGGQKSIATTMFCDIRGSSRLAEELPAGELVLLLNEHFTAMTEIIFEYGGTLDKYIGDEIMAVFGAPLSTGDDVFKAVQCAVHIQTKSREFNAMRASEGRPQVNVGIGIDTGEVIAGYIGSPMRMDFTVVGDRVNTAKRFCDMAEAGKIVVGDETWKTLGERAEGREIGSVMLKGKGKAVNAWEITGLRANP